MEKRKMENNVLRLNLKGEWYDLIESGVKKEEYREIKEYWAKRLIDSQIIDEKTKVGKIKQYDEIEFVYGYTSRTMKFKCNGIKIDTGKPEWGAESNKRYFVISIGDRIND